MVSPQVIVGKPDSGKSALPIGLPLAAGPATPSLISIGTTFKYSSFGTLLYHATSVTTLVLAGWVAGCAAAVAVVSTTAGAGVEAAGAVAATSITAGGWVAAGGAVAAGAAGVDAWAKTPGARSPVVAPARAR